MQAEGAKVPQWATTDDAPRQEPMGKGIKPADRRAPTGEQKKVRREMQRKAVDLLDPEPHSSPAKSWNMDGTSSAADTGGDATSATTPGGGGVSSTASLQCVACGCGATGTECGMCGSPSLARVATQMETAIARSDGRPLLKANDQIRLPGGQTTVVRGLRRHETSGDHWYLDTDMGTSVMPWHSTVQLVPNNTQQQSLPGYGDPRANSNSMPGQPQASGAAGKPGVPDKCPVCGGQSLINSGGKSACTRCGYTGTSQGGVSFGDNSQQIQPPPDKRRTGSSPYLTAVGRRAHEVYESMKETAL